jgi:hypothetical protein
MTSRSRLLFVVLICLTPVLIGVTSRYGESTWLVPAGLFPLFLLGPTRILPWSPLAAGVFWVGVRVLSIAVEDAAWQAK